MSACETSRDVESRDICAARSHIRHTNTLGGKRLLTAHSCGWGSASLFFAERFPNSQITAFSNSRTQKEYINTVANSKGFTNLNVITGDAAEYEFEPETFDRVVSIEMFEHMKNYHLLLEKVNRALKPGGKLFLHIFCHKDTPYDFDGGWMSEFFFTGGMCFLCILILRYFFWGQLGHG